MSTVYLDTANWIDLAEGNCSSVEFEAAVSTGDLEPVLSPIHLLELANPDHRNWRGVSSYIDRIKSMGTTHWALLRHNIEKIEVQAAFVRSRGIEPPKIRPFRDSLVETLPDNPQNPITDELRTESVKNQVESLRDHLVYGNEYLPERSHVFPELLRGMLRDPKKLILYYVPTTSPPAHPDIIVDEPTRREFAETLDIMSLPAFSMAVAYNRVRSQIEGYRPSDYEDNLHLAGLAYCDVGFADRKTCAALEQGGARICPIRNGQFEQWLTTLI